MTSRKSLQYFLTRSLVDRDIHKREKLNKAHEELKEHIIFCPAKFCKVYEVYRKQKKEEDDIEYTCCPPEIKVEKAEDKICPCEEMTCDCASRNEPVMLYSRNHMTPPMLCPQAIPQSPCMLGAYQQQLANFPNLQTHPIPHATVHPPPLPGPQCVTPPPASLHPPHSQPPGIHLPLPPQGQYHICPSQTFSCQGSSHQAHQMHPGHQMHQIHPIHHPPPHRHVRHHRHSGHGHGHNQCHNNNFDARSRSEESDKSENEPYCDCKDLPIPPCLCRIDGCMCPKLCWNKKGIPPLYHNCGGPKSICKNIRCTNLQDFIKNPPCKRRRKPKSIPPCVEEQDVVTLNAESLRKCKFTSKLPDPEVPVSCPFNKSQNSIYYIPARFISKWKCPDYVQSVQTSYNPVQQPPFYGVPYTQSASTCSRCSGGRSSEYFSVPF